MRLGRISYVNMAPVFYRLEADVEEVPGVPTELSRMLLDGEIDIAPIPSIEYARNADRLRILPRVCVSSEGAVDSIQLVTRLQFGQIRSVAVTPESATSVVLTRILLPKAEILPLGMEADATLLINATSTSTKGEPLALGPGVLHADLVAYDMAYGAGARAFVERARAAGARASDGLGMLVEQAAESYYLWRGLRPETGPVLAELRTLVA